MAEGLHSANIDLELKREVSSWQKTEVYMETLSYCFEERKAESLDKINPSSFSASEETFGICEETKTLIYLDVFIIF